MTTSGVLVLPQVPVIPQQASLRYEMGQWGRCLSRESVFGAKTSNQYYRGLLDTG
jgi:hypothetical protein